MPETPKSRDELLMELSDGMTEESGRFAERFIERIEALGLRIVPAELTQKMHDAMWEAIDMPWRHRCERAIAASPFAPEKPNG